MNHLHVTTRLNSATRFRRRTILAAGIAALCCWAVPPSLAAALIWDADTGTTGAQDGTGTWDLAGNFWWNGTANVAFTAGDSATIGATTGASALTLGVDLSTTSVTFTNNGTGKLTTVNLGGHTLTTTGTIATSGNFDAYNSIFTNGTIVLANTASSAAAPDITKVTTGAANYGSVIGAAINVGSGARFITGTTDRDDVGRYSGDLRFDGSLSGTATLNFIGGAESNTHNMHFVLNASNAGFTGAVNLTRGDLSLTNNTALSGSNAVTFNVAATGQRASLFLYGHNVTIGSLNDTSAAGSTRFIRNGSLVGTNGGTNTAGGPGSLALGLDADSTLTINQTAAGTFGGIIADGPNDNAGGAAGTYRKLAIVKNGTGALTLSGANTYTGGTTISSGPDSQASGSILVGNSSALGTGQITLTNTAQLTPLYFNTAGVNLANNIQLTSSAVTYTRLLGKNGATSTISGVISGGNAASQLRIDMDAGGSNGVLILAGNNTFVGTVYGWRGVIGITSDASLGNAANILKLDQTSVNGGLRFEAAGINVAHAIQLVSNADFNVNNFDAQISGIISGTPAATAFNIRGGTLAAGTATGTLRLSGNNTTTAAFSVSANTKLIAASPTALGAVNGTTVTSGGTLAFDTVGTYANNEALTLSGSGVQAGGVGVGALQNLQGANTFNGPIALAANSAIGVTADSLVLGGVISGAGFGVTKVGSGTLTLTGASSYTGNTIVSAGTLALGAAASFVSTPVITVDGGVFDVSAIAGGYTVGAGRTLAAGRSGTPATDVTGALSVSGTLSVGGVGAVRTYTHAGNLALNGATIAFDLGSSTTVGSGVSDYANVNGGLSLSGINNVTLTAVGGTFASGAYTLFNYTPGSLAGTAANLGVTSAASYRQTFTFDTATTPGAVLLMVGGTAPNLVWMGDGTGNVWDLNGTPNWQNGGSADKFYLTDTVNFTDAGSSVTAIALTGNLAAGAVNVSSNTSNYVFGGAGILSGFGALTKSGNSTLTITGAHTFTGGVNLNGGTISVATVANTGTASPLGASGALAFNGGTLEFTGASGTTDRLIILNGSGTVKTDTALTMTGPVTGSGALTKIGTGALTLSGASSFAGGVNINAGKVTVAALANSGTNSPLGSAGTIALAGGGTLEVTGAATTDRPMALGVGGGTLLSNVAVTLNGDISGVGALTKTGTGTLTLGGNNSNYAGGTTLAAGGLSLTSSSALGTGPLAITAATATTITLGTTAPIDVNNPIVLPTPASATTYTVLKSSAGASAGSNVNLGGVMSGGGTNLTLFFNTSATGDNSTIFHVTGANTFAGKVQLNRGILVVSSNAALGADANVLVLDSNNSFAGDLRFESPMTFTHPISTLTAANSGIINTQGNDVILSGAISGASGITKVGAGTLTLAAVNTYAAGTAVPNGTSVAGGILAVDGSIATGVNVGVAGTLAGTGTISGPAVITGILAPGHNNLGTLNFGSTVALSGTSNFEIDRTNNVLTSDRLNTTGALTLGGDLVIFASGDWLVNGDTFNLFDAASFSGSFNNVFLPFIDPELSWNTDRLAIDGTISVVPEPGSVGTFLGGLGVVCAFRRRSRK